MDENTNSSSSMHFCLNVSALNEFMYDFSITKISLMFYIITLLTLLLFLFNFPHLILAIRVERL